MQKPSKLIRKPKNDVKKTNYILSITPKDNIMHQQVRKIFSQNVNPTKIKIGIIRIKNINRNSLLVECKNIEKLKTEVKFRQKRNQELSII
jgi:hypothetical protein